ERVKIYSVLNEADKECGAVFVDDGSTGNQINFQQLEPLHLFNIKILVSLKRKILASKSSASSGLILSSGPAIRFSNGKRTDL
ncbi:8904_t:CDS:2, partial [Entrophospora sp. SA101]